MNDAFMNNQPSRSNNQMVITLTSESPQSEVPYHNSRDTNCATEDLIPLDEEDGQIITSMQQQQQHIESEILHTLWQQLIDQCQATYHLSQTHLSDIQKENNVHDLARSQSQEQPQQAHPYFIAFSHFIEHAIICQQLDEASHHYHSITQQFPHHQKVLWHPLKEIWIQHSWVFMLQSQNIDPSTQSPSSTRSKLWLWFFITLLVIINCYWLHHTLSQQVSTPW